MTLHDRRDSSRASRYHGEVDSDVTPTSFSAADYICPNYGEQPMYACARTALQDR